MWFLNCYSSANISGSAGTDLVLSSKRLSSNQSFHMSFSYFHHCFSQPHLFFLSHLMLLRLITHDVWVDGLMWTPSRLHRSIGHLCLGGGVSIGGGRFWRLSIDDGLVQRLLLRQRSHRQQCVALVLLIHLKGVLSQS